MNQSIVNFWLGLIGTLTGVLSLVLYAVEVLRYKPVISIKILKKGVYFYKRGSCGDFVSLNFKSKNDVLELIKNPFVSDFIVKVKIKILINNRGNKKATVNRIKFISADFEEDLKFYRYKNQIPISEDILIPLDVGESFLNEFEITINNKENIKNILTEPCRLEVTDNREKKITIQLGYLEV